MARVGGRKRGVGVAIAGLLAFWGSAAGAIEVSVEFHNAIDLAVCRTSTRAAGKPAFEQFPKL